MVTKPPVLVHASCVARDGAAILIGGPSGSGKSLLALTLIEHGFVLVADDQVLLHNGRAEAPAALRGLIEVRGVGILGLPCAGATSVVVQVVLGEAGLRLPDAARDSRTGAVLLFLPSGDPGNALRIKAAFQACCGPYTWVAGAGR